MQNTIGPERQRKRFFFILCASIIIAAFLLLSLLNYIEGDLKEIKINIVVIAIMVAGLISINKFDADALVYRIIHFLIGLSLFYSVYAGAGEETVLYWVFIMPLLFFYFFGKAEGLVWAVVFFYGLGFIMFMPWILGGHSYGNVTISRFFITLFIIAVIGFGLESSRYAFSKQLEDKNQALAVEKQRLEEALASIQTLKGLIPICALCKKIRDDQGYWNQLEAYISEHSDAIFSHSICPECAEKYYSDLFRSGI